MHESKLGHSTRAGAIPRERWEWGREGGREDGTVVKTAAARVGRGTINRTAGSGRRNMSVDNSLSTTP